MTPVYRITVLVIDHDRIGLKESCSVIQDANYPNDCVSPYVMEADAREVEWNDDHPLNNERTMRDAYEKLFDL